MLSQTELDRLNAALTEDQRLLSVVDAELQGRGYWIWDTEPTEF